MEKLIHVQTLLTEGELSELKVKTGEITTKDSIKAAVDHLLKGDNMGEDHVKYLKNYLREIAGQLEEWAHESEKYGWSIHQVKSINDKAKEIYEFVGRIE